MKVPQLKKKTELKSCHNTNWEDDYSWVHQPNILEVLKDGSKLDPEVRKYLEEENNYTEHHLKDTKGIQKTLFDEKSALVITRTISYEFRGYKYGIDTEFYS